MRLEGGKSGIEKLVLELFAAVPVGSDEGLKEGCASGPREDSIKGGSFDFV